ncbi:MAG TPA: hypothetical protein DEB06_03460, partial [Phycisphaerales bacterium]|nr:hypothetical protein [Phycisphaerales bacterium]
GEACVTVFIPSTPTPFTGFTITVRESEVIDCQIPVDEAVRFVLTGGVLLPDKEKPISANASGAPKSLGEPKA